jgi:hypothetical protein
MIKNLYIPQCDNTDFLLAYNICSSLHLVSSFNLEGYKVSETLKRNRRLQYFHANEYEEYNGKRLTWLFDHARLYKSKEGKYYVITHNDSPADIEEIIKWANDNNLNFKKLKKSWYDDGITCIVVFSMPLNDEILPY